MIFPDRKNESYRYTSFSKLNELKLVTPESVPTSESVLSLIAPFEEPGASRLVFVNGILSKSLSSDSRAAGFELGTFSDENPSWDDPFVSFNAAQAPEGPVIRLAKDRYLEKPLKIFLVSTGLGKEPGTKALVSPRYRIHLETGAKARVEEYHLSESGADFLENAALEIRLDGGADLVHSGIFLTPRAATGVFSLVSSVAANAVFTAHNFSLGSGLQRHNLKARLEGEGAACRLFGLYAIDGGLHVDHHTRVEHLVPHTMSEQVYKGIIAPEGRSAFGGKVVIVKNAQKSAASQLNRNLLLGPKAEANAKPELEIAADDVKCSHGATVGQLSDEEVFYLQSRGIPRELALSILVRGFAEDVLSRMENPFLRAKLGGILKNDFFNKGI